MAELVRSATEAACTAAKKRGYVVIGFPKTNHTPVTIGAFTRAFAGQLLAGYKLVITGATNRRDWNAQVLAIFGTREADKNPVRGNRYFRAELVKLGSRRVY